MVWLVSEYLKSEEVIKKKLGFDDVGDCSVVVAAIMFQVRAPLGLVLCVSGAGACFTVRAIHLCLYAF